MINMFVHKKANFGVLIVQGGSNSNRVSLVLICTPVFCIYVHFKFLFILCYMPYTQVS